MIELYHAEQCPYCVKVRMFLERSSIAYISKPVPLGSRTSPLKEELLKVSGRTQVPYLVDPENNVKMPESDDIIEYLSKKSVK